MYIIIVLQILIDITHTISVMDRKGKGNFLDNRFSVKEGKLMGRWQRISDQKVLIGQ